MELANSDFIIGLGLRCRCTLVLVVKINYIRCFCLSVDTPHSTIEEGLYRGIFHDRTALRGSTC